LLKDDTVYITIAMNLSSEKQPLDLPAVDKMDDKEDQEELRMFTE